MIHFISDLHLNEDEPATAQAFLDFLAGPARASDALWILGDLFNYWAGDDELETPFNARIAQALAALRANGTKIYLLVGNRDFLLGKRFAERAGLEIVAEPARLDLGGHTTLLVHGDAQCTDDIAYQKFRKRVRSALWQKIFLTLPLSVRHKIARGLRSKSKSSKQVKDMRIMDVNADAIAESFRANAAEWMIHGHTHRPATHTMLVEGVECVRYVLPDWHGKACGLLWDGSALTRFGQD
ncbi:UDP-2,3-diacylglucosamine diphosphatase [Uliginosibacterium sp. H3]|uniref:UDP-2,3-diacylglucosamine hydrolase n=1 Tax=Uliginosibacterium silvisoli TaxID=3114758 RepID=A0ABU6K8N0_9RHOO|nr:UDP-2,3-diacylglucosamine diphosphatase [Uliginosibacterium sp. H3]